MATWNPWEIPVDAVVLQGVVTPGIASIENAKRIFKWDQVASYGLDSAIAIYRGRMPVAFDIVIKLHNPQEYAEWGLFRQLVLDPPKPGGKARDIGHPYLVELGVMACVIGEVGQPVDDGTGIFTVRISALEWKRPRMALAKPDGAAAKNESTDPADKLIDSLVSQVQELAK
jgi:hypothetical protein